MKTMSTTLQLPFQLSDRQLVPLLRLGMLVDDVEYKVVRATVDHEGRDKGTTTLTLTPETE